MKRRVMQGTLAVGLVLAMFYILVEPEVAAGDYNDWANIEFSFFKNTHHIFYNKINPEEVVL